MTLFTMQGSYLLSFLDKPAFVSRILGEFFTQFFIFDAGGPTIMVLLLFLAWLGLKKELSSLYALLPIAAEAILSSILEYPLSMTIGFTIAVWLFVACSKRIYSIVVLAILYPLIGGHFLTFLILAVLRERKHLIFSSILVAFSIALAFIYGRFYLLTPYQTLFFPIISGYMLKYPYLFFITEASIILSFVMYSMRLKWGAWISLVAVASVVGFYLVINRQEEYDLKISTQAYRGRWNEVSALGQKNKYKTVTGAYYRNIALSREGILAEELLSGYQPLYHALFIKIKEDIGYLKAFASVDALMECQDMAQAQHSALLGMTFTPEQRSSRMARKLVEIAVANGDFAAAKKYLGMLETTLFHKKWAADILTLLKEDALKPLEGRDDILFSPNDFYASLKNIIENDPSNNVALDYLLCFNLLNKELDAFRENYDKYYYSTHSGVPPMAYQEALIMTMKEDELNIEQLKKYFIMPSTFEKCLDYNKIYELSGGDGTTLSVRYGNTYWFYYYYAQEGKK